MDLRCNCRQYFNWFICAFLGVPILTRLLINGLISVVFISNRAKAPKVCFLCVQPPNHFNWRFLLFPKLYSFVIIIIRLWFIKNMEEKKCVVDPTDLDPYDPFPNSLNTPMLPHHQCYIYLKLACWFAGGVTSILEARRACKILSVKIDTCICSHTTRSTNFSSKTIWKWIKWRRWTWNTSYSF